MPRLRRYRAFVACAVLVLFLLYRVVNNAGWEDDFESQFQYMTAVLPNPGHKSIQADDAAKPILPNPAIGDKGAQLGVQDTASGRKIDHEGPDSNALPLSPPVVVGGSGAPGTNKVASAADLGAEESPDGKPGLVGQDVYSNGPQKVIPVADPPSESKPTTTTAIPIYWTKLPERFPVKEDSLIPLPSGKAKTIPRIQHRFLPEAPEAKAVREKRLKLVKAETKRAWDAYRLYAFGHDELLPVSLTFRDPFCGWGATLIDSLDALWIMGLKDEFEDAYNGLRNMTFTTTFRNDIPVFETTIRYLGGLLAAYDLTGGHKGDYPLLLDKAVELAEVLMGTFDTPNRMPVLYYQWKPAYASQAKRAHTRAGIAELGTLSMEFTRLAQLTGKNKYYDAIARITDALEEWQNRQDESASLIPGIFPENIDAAGCNKTEIASKSLDNASPAAQLQNQDIAPGEPKGYSPKQAAVSESDMELRDDDLAFEAAHASHNIAKRAPRPQAKQPQFGESAGIEPLGADGLPTTWECVPQNLTAASGSQSFGMGGSQDSAYEYFPKQYLLLGGLEGKYRSMHEKTVAAVKKHLLYRPMTHDNADILFSAKLRIQPGNGLDLPTKINHDYEVTHLTCFLGGMFAMGGKIFESEEDVDIGRRLTDGCVWAYSSMPTGIMAETAELTPCPSIEGCQWNESAWYLAIDPNVKFREDQMELYIEALEQYEAAKAQGLRTEAVMLQAEEELGIPVRHVDNAVPKLPSARVRPSGHHDGPSLPVKYAGAQNNGYAQHNMAPNKRSEDPEIADTLPFDPSMLNQVAIEAKIKELGTLYFAEPEAPTTSIDDGETGQVPVPKVQPKPKPPFKLPRKPYKPDTHVEYAQNRIEASSLPPGYTTIMSHSYQLRPEAIESVWYMYRITGDPIWQEKGWKMWQSILSHVRVDTAHSAISGVHDPTVLRHVGSMESFWIAETLKYFYLLYSEPDVISLDDWVLNTEAHPFRRPL